MHTKTLLLFGFLVGLANSTGIAQQVEIRFRSPEVSITTDLVRLEDIAELRGGEASVRQTLSNLDIEIIERAQTSLEISAEFVRYRILLAGISDSKFHIEPGASTKVLYWQPEKINRLIEQSIFSEFVEFYHISANQLELKMISEFETALTRDEIELNSMRIVPDLPTELPIGQRIIPVTVVDAQGKSLKLQALCQVTVYRDLAMVRSPVSKGESLNEANVERVRRPINNSRVQLVSYEEALGKRAQADLQPYSVVNHQAVREPGSTSSPQNQFDMRRDAIVTIIIEQSNLRVTLYNARASRDGKIGDTIPFVNPYTKRTINAKILDPNTAILKR